MPFPKPCRGCGIKFQPRGRYNFLCDNCREDINRRNKYYKRKKRESPHNIPLDIRREIEKYYRNAYMCKLCREPYGSDNNEYGMRWCPRCLSKSNPFSKNSQGRNKLQGKPNSEFVSPMTRANKGKGCS